MCYRCDRDSGMTHRHTDPVNDVAALTDAATRLSENLRSLRTARGLTQGDVAAAAGINRNHYQLLESGRSPSGGPANPRLSTLLALAEAHGVAVTRLLSPPPAT